MIDAIRNAAHATNDADLSTLRKEQATIRPRLNKLAARYAAGDIDDEQMVVASKPLRERDNEITGILTAAGMGTPLDVFDGVDDVERYWDETLTMDEKRAVLDYMLIVTVKPTRSGGRAPDGSYFNGASVDIGLKDLPRSVLMN